MKKEEHIDKFILKLLELSEREKKAKDFLEKAFLFISDKFNNMFDKENSFSVYQNRYLHSPRYVPVECIFFYQKNFFCNKMGKTNGIIACQSEKEFELLTDTKNTINYYCLPFYFEQTASSFFALSPKKRLSDNDIELLEALYLFLKKLYSNKLYEKEVSVFYQKLYAQSLEIEKAHKNILDSINYAKTMQEALFTKKSLMDDLFNDYFLVYRPKEKIGGDFYYVNKVDKYLFFAVGDCTGHGVHGAFLTILGITYIHELLTQEKISDSGLILNKLRQKIENTFKTFGSENSSGMDIAFCVLNTDTGMLHFAGANNPLIVIHQGELITYNATRNPIGFHFVENDFSETIIPIEKGDEIFLFSDGFGDQFGGEKNKKFGTRRFRELLKEIYPLLVDKQKQEIEKTFNYWKGDEEQVDDITILGVKI